MRPAPALGLSLVLALGLGFDLGPAAIPAAHAERAQMTAQETYELGQRYLKRGYYVKALEQYNRVRTYFRDDPYALKAEIAIADMHFDRNEWDAARVAYEDFIRAHPRYPELDYVLYRLGMTHYKKAPYIAERDQAWTESAVNTWSSFSIRYPESAYREEVDALLKKARARLARKEFLIARFYDQRDAPAAVEGRLVDLLTRYPDAAEVPDALGLLGRAYAMTGRLDLARAALERLQTEFPGHPAARRLHREIRRVEREEGKEKGSEGGESGSGESGSGERGGSGE